MKIIQLIKSKFNNWNVAIRFPRESKIFTHLTSAEKLKLYHLAKENNGKIFVEIGSYLGASSCFIANGMNYAKLYCIDTWENDGMIEGKRETFDEFRKNTQKYQNMIIPLHTTSITAAKTFDKGVDFIFIDGDHSYEGVKADVDAWLPKLNKGALIIFHDIGWAEGVQRVVQENIQPLAKKEGRLPNLYWAWL
jgi:predicted O-methyltransferase YrrM